MGLAVGANGGLSAEDDIFPGTFILLINGDPSMVFYAILPSYFGEIVSFGLAARCFVHILEMRRRRPASEDAQLSHNYI